MKDCILKFKHCQQWNKCAGVFRSSVRAFVVAVTTTFATVLATAPAFAGPYVVFNADTLEVYSQETPHQRWAPASLTKIMTSYLAFKAVKSGKLTLKSPVFMSVTALNNPPTKMNFPYGTILRLDKALAIIMVKSSNDVAQAIGEAVAGSNEAFVELMNKEAKTLGMNDTHFVNANGLPDPNQYSTAHDLAVLSAAIYKDFPHYSNFLNISAIKVKHKRKNNHNGLLLNFSGTDGLKTGFVCASGFNIAAAAKRGDKHLIAIVLGEPSGRTRNAITARLLARGFAKANDPARSKNLPKLSELPQMIWHNSNGADISLAICIKGGRNRWKKGLKEYLKLLKERYYSPNPAGSVVNIKFGGATGPNPFNFPITPNGNTAQNLIGKPSPRPARECTKYYAKVLGMEKEFGILPEKGAVETTKKESITVKQEPDTSQLHEVSQIIVNASDNTTIVKRASNTDDSVANKNDISEGFTKDGIEKPKGEVSLAVEQPIKATDSENTDESKTDESSKLAIAIPVKRPIEAKEVASSRMSETAKGDNLAIAIPQKRPKQIIDEDMPFLNATIKKHYSCIPYPNWKIKTAEVRPVFDKVAEEKRLQEELEEKIKNHVLLDF